MNINLGVYVYNQEVYMRVCIQCELGCIVLCVYHIVCVFHSVLSLLVWVWVFISASRKKYVCMCVCVYLYICICA